MMPRRSVPACRPSHLAVLALVLGPLLLVGQPASAHGGGGAAARIEAGPYLVYAYDGEPGGEPDTIRYTLIVRDAETGRPVDGATVRISADSTVTAESASASIGPITATAVANVYEYTLPDVGEASWKVRATLEAPQGTATTEAVTLHGPQPTGLVERASDRTESSVSVPWGLWIALAAVAVTALTLAVVRRRPSPPHPSH